MAAACLQGDVVRRLGKENLMTTIVPQLRLLTAVIDPKRSSSPVGAYRIARVLRRKSAKADQFEGVVKAPCAIRPEMPPIMS